MIKLLTKIIFFLNFLTACSQLNILKSPLQATKTKSNLVSVQTSTDLAYSSYLLACTKIMKKFEPSKTHFTQCKQEAKKHVEENIIYILEY